MTKFLLRLLNKFHLIEKFNLNGNIKLNGKTFSIPILGKVGFSNMFMSEPWMIKLLQIVSPISNGIFVDVGVNVGQTLLKLRSVSDQIEYVGFEPNPTCIFYLQKLISNNNFKNTSLIPVGISTETELGKLFFYADDYTDSSASILENFRPEQKIERKEYIPIYSLNQVMQAVDLGKVSILKIDVEGAELEVLKSFENKIIEYKPIILIEILPVYESENIKRLTRQNEIQELFKKWGYFIHRVVKQEDVLVDIEQIDSIKIHSDLNSCEYIIVPDSKLKDFKNSCQTVSPKNAG